MRKKNDFFLQNMEIKRHAEQLIWLEYSDCFVSLGQLGAKVLL